MPIKPQADQSTKLLRAQQNSRRDASAIERVTKSSTSAVDAERGADPVSKMYEEGETLGRLTDTQKAKQITKQEIKKQAEQSSEIQAFATESLEVARNLGEVVARGLLSEIFKDEHWNVFKKSNQNGELVDLSPEEREAKEQQLDKNPTQLAFVSKEKALDYIKVKKKEYKDDPEKLAEIEGQEAQAEPIFYALDALKGNGSHLKLVDYVYDLKNVSVKMGDAITDYIGSLEEVARVQTHARVMIERQLAARVGGIDTTVDKREYKRLFARTGGVISDRNGGISGAGQVYNYMEADIVHAGDPYEYYDVA